MADVNITKRFFKKSIDFLQVKCYNILAMWKTNRLKYAGMAEQADARDLKSREIYFSYRFDPGFRHHISRSGAVWQLVGLITRRS